MPALSGLDAAAELADAWESQAPPGTAFPALVFVTAYDHYALAAFEAHALDYLLKVLQVSVGMAIRLLPMNEVLVFEATDKYVQVLTASHAYLIRTPLKDLLPQLDPAVFWQIHRGTVVNVTCIDAVTRDEAGKLSVSLRGKPGKLAVSRLYAHLFKAM